MPSGSLNVDRPHFVSVAVAWKYILLRSLINITKVPSYYLRITFVQSSYHRDRVDYLFTFVFITLVLRIADGNHRIIYFVYIKFLHYIIIRERRFIISDTVSGSPAGIKKSCWDPECMHGSSGDKKSRFIRLVHYSPHFRLYF